ncbi:ArsR family transcriptional regulator [Peribacillus frigoritolerans]|nr:ArsR family transcriptional regulator [Peribacillus frigoritolerans]
MNKQDQLNIIKEDFINCQKVLLAIGDETRQSILSRPAVSHHLKVLRDAGVILMRKEGTKNFYYINVRTELGLLRTLVLDIDKFMQNFY